MVVNSIWHEFQLSSVSKTPMITAHLAAHLAAQTYDKIFTGKIL